MLESSHGDPVTIWLRCVLWPVHNLTSFLSSKGERLSNSTDSLSANNHVIKLRRPVKQKFGKETRATRQQLVFSFGLKKKSR